MEKTVADNDRDNASDDKQEGEGSEVKKRLGLPQPLLIKIGLGLIVLLLAAGGYFFLMAEEPPVVEDAAETQMINEDQLIAPPSPEATANAEEESADKVMALREQTMTLREENLQLRERIFQLESELTTFKEANKQSAHKNNVVDSQFINNYGNDEKAFPPIITEPAKPRPKPKWGEFERVK
jgi:flagellar basal body-associated protein FliL